jgi:hypothetical protein|tara:strand:+ start:5280 stop:5984 length:705 start_codon:yes stop_codon:yes gene_type:complete
VNILEMRDYIRSVVDIDVSDISDDVLNRFLGEGYDLIVYSDKRWPFYEVQNTFPTVADQKDYSLAEVGVNITNGLREINALRTDRHVITFVGRDEGDVVYPIETNTTGEPWWWSYWAESVRLYPTPSSVLTVSVRGYGDPTAFGAGSADTVSPSDLPTPFHVVVATYGLARAYEQQEDPTMANQYFAIFQQEFTNLKARYNDMPAPQPVLLNSRSASRWRSQVILPNRLRYGWE